MRVPPRNEVAFNAKLSLLEAVREDLDRLRDELPPFGGCCTEPALIVAEVGTSQQTEIVLGEHGWEAFSGTTLTAERGPDFIRCSQCGAHMQLPDHVEWV